MPRRVLITGADGFIGSHCVDHLLATTDWDLVLICSWSHGGMHSRLGTSDHVRRHRGRVTVVTHDLRGPIDEVGAFQIGDDCDAVIHFAADSHVDRSLEAPVPFVMNNVAVTLNLLEWARRQKALRAFIQISTDEVYGPAGTGEAHAEWSPIIPSNPYCLLPDTRVVTPRGPVAISEFSTFRDRVLSRDGTKSTVPTAVAARRWEFDHDGEVLTIKVRGGDKITSTPNHVFFVREAANDGRPQGGGHKVFERRAADLKVGDRVGMVRKIPFPPESIEENPSLARFLGYWMGDGSYSKRTRYVRVADSKIEYLEYYRARLAEVVPPSHKSSTGALGTIYKHGTKNCWYFQVASESLRGLIDINRKSVMAFAMNCGPNALRQWIAGLIDADGSVALDANGRVKAVSICDYDDETRELTRFLLRRLGVVACDYDDGGRLTVSAARDIRALYEQVPTLKWPERFETAEPQGKNGRAENWYWARVEEITASHYCGKVYDLHVPAHERYVANYFLVHNSGSKAAQEAVACSYWRAYGVPVIVTSTMNNVGEKQHPEKFLPKIIRHLMRGEPVPVHAVEWVKEWPGSARPPELRRTVGSRFYLHARNHADACRWLIERDEVSAYPAPGRDGPFADRPDRWNVVGEVELGNDELVRMVAGIMRRMDWTDMLHRPTRLLAGRVRDEEIITYVDAHSARPGHDLRYALDGRKLAAAGWVPPVPFEESLRRTVEWYCRNPEWLMMGSP